MALARQGLLGVEQESALVQMEPLEEAREPAEVFGVVRFAPAEALVEAVERRERHGAPQVLLFLIPHFLTTPPFLSRAKPCWLGKKDDLSHTLGEYVRVSPPYS